ncbi:hypothetical protein CHELA20_51894 [Hyphomicrobiales bacterium]|nr:hypothetical protein CHELA41_23118 [Hyphomicrobiales bacterium]CAH1679255.1 hypothetical protein CHELA20_51894 [Hyphomicrobiales bacterium]
MLAERSHLWPPHVKMSGKGVTERNNWRCFRSFEMGVDTKVLNLNMHDEWSVFSIFRARKKCTVNNASSKGRSDGRGSILDGQPRYRHRRWCWKAE